MYVRTFCGKGVTNNKFVTASKIFSSKSSGKKMKNQSLSNIRINSEISVEFRALYSWEENYVENNVKRNVTAKIRVVCYFSLKRRITHDSICELVCNLMYVTFDGMKVIETNKSITLLTLILAQIIKCLLHSVITV